MTEELKEIRRLAQKAKARLNNSIEASRELAKAVRKCKLNTHQIYLHIKDLYSYSSVKGWRQKHDAKR